MLGFYFSPLERIFNMEGMISNNLTAKIEPFDTFWEAPDNIEKGFHSFGKFYHRNYLSHLPTNKDIRILVLSCGPGYFVNLLKEKGYTNILGIDSEEEKIRYAKKKGLNCKVAHAFDYLIETEEQFDLIFGEQEINHLTKDEIIQFFNLCKKRLNEKGMLIIHSLNGANPITGAEAMAQNFDHYNTFTDYSLKQVLKFVNFKNIKVIPLNLYIFYENPLNYIGLILNKFLNLVFILSFIFYGKKNKIFTKKIAAVCTK
jgi:2-polyprenyl-3-methyl-5-hydroxy-6-metoxy-1,4-benzoquinol methylase